MQYSSPFSSNSPLHQPDIPTSHPRSYSSLAWALDSRKGRLFSICALYTHETDAIIFLFKDFKDFKKWLHQAHMYGRHRLNPAFLFYFPGPGAFEEGNAVWKSVGGVFSGHILGAVWVCLLLCFMWFVLPRFLAVWYSGWDGSGSRYQCPQVKGIWTETLSLPRFILLTSSPHFWENWGSVDVFTVKRHCWSGQKSFSQL